MEKSRFLPHDAFKIFSDFALAIKYPYRNLLKDEIEVNKKGKHFNTIKKQPFEYKQKSSF